MTVNLIETKTLRQIGSVELEDHASHIASLQNEAVSRLAKMMNIAIKPEVLHNASSNATPSGL